MKTTLTLDLVAEMDKVCADTDLAPYQIRSEIGRVPLPGTACNGTPLAVPAMTRMAAVSPPLAALGPFLARAAWAHRVPGHPVVAVLPLSFTALKASRSVYLDSHGASSVCDDGCEKSAFALYFSIAAVT